MTRNAHELVLRDEVQRLTRERDIARASARAASDDLMQQMARTDEVLRERDEARAEADRWAERCEGGWTHPNNVRCRLNKLEDDNRTLTGQRDAAISRAEAAEEQCSMRERALDHLEGQRDAARYEAARASADFDTQLKIRALQESESDGMKDITILKRERDAAIARAEKAERERALDRAAFEDLVKRLEGERDARRRHR